VSWTVGLIVAVISLKQSVCVNYTVVMDLFSAEVNPVVVVRNRLRRSVSN